MAYTSVFYIVDGVKNQALSLPGKPPRELPEGAIPITREQYLDPNFQSDDLIQSPEWQGAYSFLLRTPLQARITQLANTNAPVARVRGDIAIALLAPVDDETKRASLTAAVLALHTALEDASQGLDPNERAILNDWNDNYHLGLELGFL